MNFLQSIPSPEISFFEVGPFRIHFYALFILTGIAFAIWLGNRRFVARGGSSGAILDIALWAVPSGIIGGRFYHVITHADYYFHEGADLSKVFAIWEGGLAIYGALVFGTLGAYLGARTAGIRFLSFADAIAPGVIVAQAIGRLGNYFNNELFGLPTNLPWGLEISSLNDAGFAALIWLDRKYQLRWGRMFGLYLVTYSIGRAFIESIRIDPSDYYFGLRTNVWSAIFGAIVGLAIIWWSRRSHPGLETSVYLPGKEPVIEIESAAVASNGKSDDALDSKSTKAVTPKSKS
ncbi:MAG: hypothetical protein RLZZ340_348 [Actinomycetota bacterium]